MDPTGMDPTGMDPTGMDPTGMDPTGMDRLAGRSLRSLAGTNLFFERLALTTECDGYWLLA